MTSYPSNAIGIPNEPAPALRSALLLIVSLLLIAAAAVSAFAQTPPAPTPLPAVPTGPAAAPATAAAPGVTPPTDYVIGPDDVLRIVFWRDEAMTGDVAVRPDGKITLPLLNDVVAAGLTPEQLRTELMTAATKFVEEPSVTVVVKEIRSRKVFITGQVNKPGPYALGGPTTVLQLIAMAGGVLEFADSKNIIVMRSEPSGQQTYRFNYQDVIKRKNPKQNLELKPGDTVVVP